MTQINPDELKTLQLEIMQTIHDFCEKNKISYSLCGGTMIGSVRHNGYIPWDDDIDIMMTRPDYEKFAELFNDSSIQTNSTFKYIDCYNDKQYFQPFGKVVNTKTFMKEHYDRNIDNYGVNVDVFPCDGLPNDEKKRDAYWKKIKRMKYINTFIYSKSNKRESGLKKLIRPIMFTIFKIFSSNHFAKKINEEAKKNDFENSQFVACSVFGYGRKEEMPKSVFNSFVDVPFEDKTLKAMEGYKTYLTNLYGDYMQLPPVEKQVAKHDFEVFWR